MIIIQPLAKTGMVISSKENFQSTQLYSQVQRFIISWNGRRFDSVGCFHVFSSSYTGGYGHLSNYRVAKFVIFVCYFCSLIRRFVGFFVWNHLLHHSSVGFSRFYWQYIFIFPRLAYYSIEIFSLLPLLELNFTCIEHVVVTPWICMKFKSYWLMISHNSPQRQLAPDD